MFNPTNISAWLQWPQCAIFSLVNYYASARIYIFHPLTPTKSHLNPNQSLLLVVNKWKKHWVLTHSQTTKFSWSHGARLIEHDFSWPDPLWMLCFAGDSDGKNCPFKPQFHGILWWFMGISPTKNGNINLNYSLAIQYSYGIDGSFADDLPIFHSYVKLQRADFFPKCIRHMLSIG